MIAYSTDEQQWVLLGKVSGLFGVKGWLKIYSNTQPRENILTYSPWFIQRDGIWQEYDLLEGKAHNKGVIAQLSGCTDRDIAAELIGAQISIKREQLPEPISGEYYWRDLTGLRVTNLQGVELGKLESMLETGANDVMVVHGLAEKGKSHTERLIPYVVDQIVREVNLEQGFIVVDWNEDY